MHSTSHRLALRVTLLILVALGALAAWGIATRTRALAEVARQTDEMAITKVAVVKPTLGAGQQELVSTVQARAESPQRSTGNRGGRMNRWVTWLSVWPSSA